MKKRICVALIVLLVLIVGIGGFFFVRNMLNDSRITNERIKEIKTLKTNFEESILDYNKSRSSLLSIVDGMVVDEMTNTYQNVYSLLEKEEKDIVKVKDYVLKLDSDCKGKIYSDANVNGYCLEYRFNYEQMVNVFLEDVKNVNNIIEKYNQSHSESLKVYSSDIKDYIDYNEDGNYSGKGE